MKNIYISLFVSLFSAEIHLYFREMAFNPIMPSVVLIALHQHNNGNDDFFLFLSQILHGIQYNH